MDREQMEQLEMQETEANLRHCLQHVAPPAGFDDRVMARLAQRRGSRAGWSRRTGALTVMHRGAGWWTAAAAVLLMVAGGDAVHLKHQRQEREATQVQQQMDLAMQLTSHALDQVDEGLSRTDAGRYTQILDSLQK